MITREEVEVALQQKYEQGEADVGLYKTDLCYVVMDRVDGKFQFNWFESAVPLSDVISE